MRGGHRPRVPSPDDVDRLEVALVEAFQHHDPSQAWQVAQELLTLARQTTVEAAKARFQVNFGTPVCDDCEGLKAGPGVVATCFQRRQCYYTNFGAGSLSPKHQRVIQSLLGDESG